LFWRVVDGSKFFLSEAFKAPAFEFYEKIYGRQRYEQRWKRCVSRTKSLLSVSVNAMLAKKEGLDQNKVAARKLIKKIQQQATIMIHQFTLPILLKNEVLQLVNNVQTVSGYPKEYYNDSELEKYYKDLEVVDGKYFETVLKLKKFSRKSNGHRLLTPIKETEWQYLDDDTSFFDDSLNLLYVHSNDLKSPTFDSDLPNYVNYAGLGWRVSNYLAISIISKVSFEKLRYSVINTFFLILF
jgi:predicted metalloendopeptidase